MIPVAIVVTDVRGDLRLLHAGVAVPVAFVLGVAGIRLARKARTPAGAHARPGRRHGRRPDWGACSRWIGVYFALIGAISLGVYAIEYYELLS